MLLINKSIEVYRGLTHISLLIYAIILNLSVKHYAGYDWRSNIFITGSFSEIFHTKGGTHDSFISDSYTGSLV